MTDSTIVMTTAAASLGWPGACLCALAGAGLALVALRKNRRRRAEILPVWNSTSALVGTHDGVITRKAEAAITVKHLLGKLGSSAAQVAIAGASDAPLYVIPDEAGAAGDAVACEILGVTGRTVRMVASDAISAGAMLAPANNGRVRTLPSSAGTYFVVGRALSSSGGSGDVLEVASCVARQVTVS